MTENVIIYGVLTAMASSISVMQALALVATIRHRQAYLQAVLTCCMLVQGLASFYFFAVINEVNLPFADGFGLNMLVAVILCLAVIVGASCAGSILHSFDWRQRAGQDQDQV